MDIRSAAIRLNPPTVPTRPEPPEHVDPPASKKSADIPNYTGPTDGESHYNPKAARLIRPFNKAMMHLLFRIKKTGMENIPKEGAHELCFNHRSYLDPPLVSSLTNRDWRFMAAKEQFTGPVGWAMTEMGAFPVERGGHSNKPFEVSVHLLNQGKGLAIFPEGRIWEDGSVHDFKEGPAMIAIHSDCESLVPGAIHYEPSKEKFGSRLLNYASATAVVAGSVAVAAFAGPVAAVGAGIVTGLIAGASVGAAIGMARAKGPRDLRVQARAALKMAAKTAVAGAVVGGLGATFLHGGAALTLASALGFGTGAATLAFGKFMSGRDTAYIAVGKPIAVEPYRQMHDKKEARAKLTAELHQAVVDLKAQITK